MQRDHAWTPPRERRPPEVPRIRIDNVNDVGVERLQRAFRDVPWMDGERSKECERSMRRIDSYDAEPRMRRKQGFWVRAGSKEEKRTVGSGEQAVEELHRILIQPATVEAEEGDAPHGSQC